MQADRNAGFRLLHDGNDLLQIHLRTVADLRVKAGPLQEVRIHKASRVDDRIRL